MIEALEKELNAAHTALSEVARGLGVSDKNVWSVDRFRNVWLF
jgi:hypothetical protein